MFGGLYMNKTAISNKKESQCAHGMHIARDITDNANEIERDPTSTTLRATNWAAIIIILYRIPC